MFLQQLNHFPPNRWDSVSAVPRECWSSPMFHICACRFSSNYEWSYINLLSTVLSVMLLHRFLFYSAAHQVTNNIGRCRVLLSVSIPSDLGRISAWRSPSHVCSSASRISYPCIPLRHLILPSRVLARFLFNLRSHFHYRACPIIRRFLISSCVDTCIWR